MPALLAQEREVGRPHPESDEQIAHRGRRGVAESEVEGSEAGVVPELRLLQCRRARVGRRAPLERLRLHDDRRGTLGEDGFDGELVRHAHVA